MRRNEMSEEKQRMLYVASDFATSFVAFVLFNVCRYNLLYGDGNVGSYIFSPKLLVEEFAVPVVMLGVYWLSGYYNIPFGKSRLQEIITTFNSALVNTVLLYLILLINDQTGERIINYELIVYLVGLLFVFPYAGRIMLTVAATRRFKLHKLEYRVMIVGNVAAGRKLARRLEFDKSRVSYNVVAFAGIGEDAGKSLEDGFKEMSGNVKVCGLDDDLKEKCLSLDIDQVILAPYSYDEKMVLEVLNLLFPLGIPVKIAPDTISYVTSAIRLKDIYGDPFVDLTSPVMSESSKNIKRMLDVSLSLLLLVSLSPVMAWLALLVKRSSPGPVIYSQERIGLKKRPFRIYKFRTMRMDAETGQPKLAEDNDPRVTSVGRVLRKYRLDELPQFWNVVKGDMSIVGPRPERRYFIEKIMVEAPYYALVYQVRPGITSWGMVKYGYASDVRQMVERTKYDLIYMSNMSLFVDMKILIYTVKTVVTGKGI